MKISIIKFVFIFLFLNSSLFADYLLTIYENVNSGWNSTSNQTFSRCIKSYYTLDDRLIYLKSADNTYYQRDFNNITSYNVKSGFIYKDEKCLKFDLGLSDLILDNTLALNSDNLSFLGLSDNELNFSFALSGVFISMMFLYGIFRFI